MRFAPLVTIACTICALTGCFNEPEPAYKTVPAASYVYLSDKELTKLPEVNRLAVYLNLDRNKLENVDGINNLTKLKWLRLNSNKLSSLPDLKALVELRRIYLKNNNFTAVPETLKDLPSLTDIELSGNPINEVPEWLASKRGLENLSFNFTAIKKLPADISAWSSLKSLQLGDTPLGEDAEEMARIRAALPDVAIIF
ncbi:MAG: leucine-rich repeat domain-containing protein [Kiritimatiellae bacterium]|nr:leucine-rich repeat domain-containing protein [Kiritimatiellia bacterium]